MSNSLVLSVAVSNAGVAVPKQLVHRQSQFSDEIDCWQSPAEAAGVE